MKKIFMNDEKIKLLNGLVDREIMDFSTVNNNEKALDRLLLLRECARVLDAQVSREELTIEDLENEWFYLPEMEGEYKIIDNQLMVYPTNEQGERLTKHEILVSGESYDSNEQKMFLLNFKELLGLDLSEYVDFDCQIKRGF